MNTPLAVRDEDGRPETEHSPPLRSSRRTCSTSPPRRRAGWLTQLPFTHNHLVVDTLSVTLAALSDPTRRAILARLTMGPAAVVELCEPFGVSQQAISKHLAYLERANLVRTRRVGRRQIRELNPAPLREVAEWTEDYRRFWEGAFNRLGNLLKRQAAAGPRRTAKR